MNAEKIILKNGLRVIFAPMRSSLTANVLVLVEAGSEYETKDINGISHFLEHLAFKGTVKRPKPGMIARELDSIGAEYNAFTSQEYTGYWAKARADALPDVLDLISDLYLNPIFNEDEIDKERGVIIEEINMYEDMPMRKVGDIFTSLLYGDQPAGWDIAGKKGIVKKLKKNDFLKYRDVHYIAPSTVVVVAGNFDKNKSFEFIKNAFNKLKRRRKILKPKTNEFQKKPQASVRFKKSDQTHLVVGVRTFSIFDKRRYCLQVLSEILGGSMSSRLFHRVREELGAAYYIKSSAELLFDHGYFSVSAGVDHSKANIVLRAILDEFSRLRNELVSDEEIERAKRHLVGSIILDLETSDELAYFYGGQEILTKSFISPKLLVRNIERVKKEEIKKLANDIFLNSKLNLAVIGPYRSKSAFESELDLER